MNLLKKGAVCAVILCLFVLCGCTIDRTGDGGGNSASAGGDLSATVLSMADVTAKAGDTVTLTLSVDSSAALWGFSWDVNFDSAVLTPTAEDVAAFTEDFEMDVTVNEDAIILQGSGREIQNYEVTGRTITLTFQVAKDAAAGEYPVNVGCKDSGNNINVDGAEVPFSPVTATVTVEG